MKILVGLLSTMNIGQTMMPVQLNNNINQSLDSVINMDDIKLKDSKINIHSIANSEFNEEKLVSTILTGIKKENSDVDNFNEVMVDVLKNYDDWVISNLPSQYPDEGVTEKYELGFIYIGSEPKFEGIMFANVELYNEDTSVSNNLEDLLTDTYLETINNLTEQKVLEEIIIQNIDANITKEDLEIVSIDYFETIVKGTKESGLEGSVTFKYNSTYTSDFDWESKELYEEAYNSTQQAYDSVKLEIIPSLGKEKFQEKFSKIHFRGIGYDYNNEHGRREIDTDTFPEKENSTLKEDTAQYKGILNINKSSDEIMLFDRNYINVNQMRTNSWATSYWNCEKLEIEFTVGVWCYATAWNAYWAKAGAQMHYTNVYFE